MNTKDLLKRAAQVVGCSDPIKREFVIDNGTSACARTDETINAGCVTHHYCQDGMPSSIVKRKKKP